MSHSTITPIGALMRGALAGLVGTTAMDLVLFRRYRRSGGADGPIEWEFSAGTESYEAAAAPAQVGRRIVEGALQIELDPKTARAMNNAVHWATGAFWGAAHGLLAGSTPQPRTSYGVGTGALAWAASYALLTPMKLYEPPWKYPGSVLAKDLNAHLAYGVGTAAAFRLLVGEGRRKP